MFSIIEPGKHLPAHKRPYHGVLRLHLGLIVPEPRDQVSIRVVLFVDFVKPQRFPGRLYN